MSLSEAASLLTIAKFAHSVYARLRRKKPKRKSRTRKPRTKTRAALAVRTPTKEEELATELVTNPGSAIKKMTAEYIVKNRNKIIKGISDYLVDEFG